MIQSIVLMILMRSSDDLILIDYYFEHEFILISICLRTFIYFAQSKLKMKVSTVIKIETNSYFITTQS